MRKNKFVRVIEAVGRPMYIAELYGAQWKVFENHESLRDAALAKTPKDLSERQRYKAYQSLLLKWPEPTESMSVFSGNLQRACERGSVRRRKVKGHWLYYL